MFPTSEVDGVGGSDFSKFPTFFPLAFTSLQPEFLSPDSGHREQGVGSRGGLGVGPH